MKTTNLLAMVCVLCFGLSACEKKGEQQNELKPERGSVSGRATDAKGFPLKNVAIALSHTVWTDKSLHATTDSSGFYKVVLPAEPRGNWNIVAEYATTAYGQDLSFTLDASDNSSFGGVRGAIRNFKWRLSGENINGVYGAAIHVHQKKFNVPLEQVKLILSPLEDLLIDGSDAKAMERTLENVAGNFMATDVPVGRYMVQAFIDNRALKIAANKKSVAKDTAEIIFTGSGRSYAADIYISN